jgi:hypothetical protein
MDFNQKYYNMILAKENNPYSHIWTTVLSKSMTEAVV